MKQVAEMSLQHFSSSELCPRGPVIPAQRDASFFAPAVLTSTTWLGIFDNGFSAWFTTCFRKIRGEILVYHETPPKGVSLLRRVSYRQTWGPAPGTDGALWHRWAMNSGLGGPSPSRSATNSVVKAPFSTPARLLLPQLAAHAGLLGRAAAGDKHGANKEVSHEGP